MKCWKRCKLQARKEVLLLTSIFLRSSSPQRRLQKSSGRSSTKSCLRCKQSKMQPAQHKKKNLISEHDNKESCVWGVSSCWTEICLERGGHFKCWNLHPYALPGFWIWYPRMFFSCVFPASDHATSKRQHALPPMQMHESLFAPLRLGIDTGTYENKPYFEPVIQRLHHIWSQVQGHAINL